MRKQDFIRELTTALAPINAQSRAEIIADIEEHFAEGAAHGQSEEEICRNLGQPGHIAEQVLEEYKAFQAQQQDGFSAGNNSGGNASGFGNNAEDFATGFENNIENFTSSIEDAVSSAMKSVDLGGIISSALKSASEATRAASEAMQNAADDTDEHRGNDPRIFGFQFGQGAQTSWEAAEVDQEGVTRVRGGYEIDIDKSFSGVASIDAALSICNINLLPAPQSGDVRVTIKGRSRCNMFILENNSGNLVIHQRDKFFRFDLFRFNSNLEVNIYVPASFGGDIKVVSSAGNISASGITGNLVARASAGKIKVDGLKGDMAHLRASAGNISLTGSHVRNINAKASAGNVTVESQEAASLILNSSAGNIDVHVGRLSGNAELKSSAGTVRLKAHDVQGNITAKSSAGNIYMCLPRDANCRISAKKPSMGSLSNYLTGNPDSPYTLRASSSVGSIVLDVLEPAEPADPRQN